MVVRRLAIFLLVLWLVPASAQHIVASPVSPATQDTYHVAARGWWGAWEETNGYLTGGVVSRATTFEAGQDTGLQQHPTCQGTYTMADVAAWNHEMSDGAYGYADGRADADRNYLNYIPFTHDGAPFYHGVATYDRPSCEALGGTWVDADTAIIELGMAPDALRAARVLVFGA